MHIASRKSEFSDDSLAQISVKIDTDEDQMVTTIGGTVDFSGAIHVRIPNETIETTRTNLFVEWQLLHVSIVVKK